MSSFVSLEDVKKIYQMGEVQIMAAAGIDFQIERGEFAVVVGHIHIGVQLLAGHLQTAAFEQTAQRCGCDALAKAGDDTAGDKDEFGLFLCHRISSSIFVFLNSFPYKPL